MISRLIRRFMTGGPLYIRLRSEWLSVRDVATSEVMEDAPLAAICGHSKEKIAAIGAAARDAAQRIPDCRLVNPFDHPRTIIGDFPVAEKVLQYFVRKVYQRRVIRPIMVLHPLEKLEGGLTNVEMRALRELGDGSGAWEVYIFTGRELTDYQIRNVRFLE